MAAVHAKANPHLRERNWDVHLDDLLNDLQLSVTPYTGGQEESNASGPYGVIQSSSATPQHVHRYQYYREKSSYNEGDKELRNVEATRLVLPDERGRPETPGIRGSLQGKQGAQRRSFAERTSGPLLGDAADVRKDLMLEHQRVTRTYRGRSPCRAEDGRGGSLERRPLAEASSSARGRSLDRRARDGSTERDSGRFFREENVERRSFRERLDGSSASDGRHARQERSHWVPDGPRARAPDGDGLSGRWERTTERSLFSETAVGRGGGADRRRERSAERKVFLESPRDVSADRRRERSVERRAFLEAADGEPRTTSSARYCYEERSYPSSPLPNPRLKQNIKELDNLLHGLNNTRQQEILDKKELYRTSQLREEVPVGHSTPYLDRPQGKVFYDARVEGPTERTSELLPLSPEGGAAALPTESGKTVVSSKKIYKQYKYDWSSTTKNVPGGEDDGPQQQPQPSLPAPEAPTLPRDAVVDAPVQRRRPMPGPKDDEGPPPQQQQPQRGSTYYEVSEDQGVVRGESRAAATRSHQTYHPAEVICQSEVPRNRSQYIPKKVDDLMASMSDSEDYSTSQQQQPPGRKPASSPRQPAATAAFSASEERVQQQSQQMLQRSYRDGGGSETFQSPPTVPEVKGPAVYYPPTFGDTMGPDGGQVKVKEGWRAEQSGGGKARAKGKWKYSHTMKEKGKEKKGAVAIPICLPLCCAAPLCCTVM